MAISICRHMMPIYAGKLVDYEYPDELIKESHCPDTKNFLKFLFL